MREGVAGSAVAAFDAAVEGLLAVDLDTLSDDELLRFVSDVERVVRRVSAVQDMVTAAVDQRGLAHGRGCSTTAALLRRLLRLSAGEAKARVRAADRFAPRRALSGEVLAPLLPEVAAARTAGEISVKQAADLAAAIDAIPAHVDETDAGGGVAGIESFLVEQARVFTPEELSVVTRRLLATLNPDGTLAEVEYRERRRDLTLHQRPDGSVCGSFDGTAEFGELLLTILDVTAAPVPAADGVPDTRTAGQRRHDGLLAAFRVVLRAGQLPTAHGVLATIVLTTTREQWASDSGLARTGHGALIPISEAKNIARGDARTMTVTLNPDSSSTGIGIAGWTDTRRFFTENQRLAMTARDGGCTFPGCNVPAAWCDADHVIDHAKGGPTSIDNGHLACGYHHRAKNRTGWTVHMINQLPHWTAPPWLDPGQTPRRNHTHHPVGVG